MSQKAPDRTYWVVAVLGSGDETKIGESFSSREWCVDIDSRENEYGVTVRARTVGVADQEIEVGSKALLRVFLRGKELILYNGSPGEITVKYSYP